MDHRRATLAFTALVAVVLVASPAHAELCDKFEDSMAGAALLYGGPGMVLTGLAYVLSSRVAMALCLLWGVAAGALSVGMILDPDLQRLWESEPWCREGITWWRSATYAIAPAGVIVPALLLIRLMRLRRRAEA